MRIGQEFPIRQGIVINVVSMRDTTSSAVENVVDIHAPDAVVEANEFVKNTFMLPQLSNSRT
jgi:hypothetical protein